MKPHPLPYRPCPRPARPGAPRRHPLVAALVLAGLASSALLPGQPARAQALPSGPTVVQGSAAVAVQGGQMTVTHSAGAALNWQSFSIGAGNGVHFQQPDAASRVLNRVVGKDPSAIFGRLTSNGEVWLVNPNGVLFGRDARVDVRGLVASTLAIGNDDWRAGRFVLRAAEGDPAAPLVNQGELRSTLGGRVLLLGGAGGVRNEGLIVAPDGQVALAAGQGVELADAGLRHVAVRVQAPQGEALNLGSVAVGGGRVDLAAAMVNQQGLVRADALQQQGGQIVLSASRGVELGAASRTSAQGAQGGAVAVDAGEGRATLAGAIVATGGEGRGGDVQLLGREVALLDGSAVDVSGQAGGGSIHAGGGAQGRDPALRNADALYMGAGARLAADATGQGDGGRIVLWSDRATRAYGSFSARGGAAGGDGGFVETSGGSLDAQPASVRTDAPAGAAGLWLLDPNNIFISDSVSTFNVSAGPNFETLGAGAGINPATLVAALQAGNNVSISTAVAAGGIDSGQAGNINMSGATIAPTLPTRVSLTLSAARNITLLDVLIRANGAPLDLVLSAANSATAPVGEVVLQNARIFTAGGDVTIGGGAQAQGPNLTSPRAGAVGWSGGFGNGIAIIGSTLDAGSGTIRMTGQATGGSQGANGVFFRDDQFPTLVTARDIDIWGWVDSNVNLSRRGVYVDGSFTEIVATHSLTITGLSNSGQFHDGANGEAPIGVSMLAGRLEVRPPAADPTARLAIDGSVNDAPAVASGVGRRIGVNVASDSSIVAAGGGARVDIVGHDQMRDPDFSAAVVLGEGGALMDFAGAGTVTVQGDTRVGLAGPLSLPGGQPFAASAGTRLVVDGDLSGDAASLTLNAQDIAVTGSIAVASSTAGSVALQATRDIDIDGGSILAMSLPTPITLEAAAGGSGAGRIQLQLATIQSQGGDVLVGGGSFAAGPTLTSPRAGAVGTAGPGVALLGTSIDAGSGRITLAGQSVSTSGDAYGVLLTGFVSQAISVLQARDIELWGWVDSNASVARAGVRVDAFGVVSASHSATITGLAHSAVYQDSGSFGPAGVVLEGFVGVLPQAADPSATLAITGRTQDAAAPAGRLPPHTRAGVWIESPGRSLVATGGASVAITGTDASPNAEPAVRIAAGTSDFSAAGAVSVGGNGLVQITRNLLLPGGQPVAVVAGGDLELLDLSASGSPSALTFEAAGTLRARGDLVSSGPGTLELRAREVDFGVGDPFVVDVGGAVTLFTDRFVTDQPSSITTLATGDAIVLAGFDRASNIAQVRDNGSPTALVASAGRWLLYGNEADFANPALSYDFRQYAATYPAPALGSGNGLLFDAAPVLQLNTGAAITKVYDATTAAASLPATAFGLTGLRPGHSAAPSTSVPTLAYASADAATGIAVTAAGYSLPAIVDTRGLPVLGYGVASALAGDITPRPVTLSGVTAADKVYDGGTAATLLGGTLANLVGGQTLTPSYANAQFSDPDAGTNKSISGVAALQDGSGLAANYTLVGTTVTASAAITPRPLTIVGVSAADKVYDGSTTATLAGGTLGNLVAGETLGLVLGSASFDTAHAGSAKPVTGSASVVDGSGRVANYLLAGGGVVHTSASVMPRPVTLSGVIVADKVYDGGTAASFSGGTLGNLVAGETLSFVYTNGQFSLAGAGSARAASAGVSLVDGSGRASNYQAPASASGSAAILPATLTYTADPALTRVGQFPVALSGQVSGFVANETLAGATTGTLAFTTPADALSPPGSYAVLGGGLTAPNYVFVQAAANASALTVLPGLVDTVLPSQANTALAAGERFVRLAAPTADQPPAPQALDAVGRAGVVSPDPSGVGLRFAPLAFDRLSLAGLSALLDARGAYKQSVLAAGMAQLEADPGLADLPACQNVAQAEAGRCLVDDALIAGEGAGDTSGAAVAAAPATLAAPAPSPPAGPAAPGGPAPAPVAPPPPAAGAAAPTVPPAPAAAAPTLPPAPGVVPVPSGAAVPAAPAPVPAPATPPSLSPPAPPAPVSAPAAASPALAAAPAALRPAAHPVMQPPRLPAARPVRSAAVPQIARKLAVLVGVDNYVDASIPSLENAGRDVDAVARLLEGRLGYETVVVRDASRQALVGVLNRLALTARPDDSVIVYYAGHGTVVESTGRGYWIPADADAARPQSWVANTDIERLMGSVRARQVVLIADSCFSGSLVDLRRKLPPAPEADLQALLARRAAVVMSSGGNEPVADGGRNGHSPFAASLMRTLQDVDAWRPGTNVFQRVRDEVTRRIPQTPQYGPARQGRHAEGADYLFEQRQLDVAARR